MTTSNNTTTATVPPLSPEAREVLRRTITNHPKWEQAKEHAGISRASEIRKEHYGLLASYLNIDLDPFHSDAWRELPVAADVLSVKDKQDAGIGIEPDEHLTTTPAGGVTVKSAFEEYLSKFDAVLSDKALSGLRDIHETEVSRAKQAASAASAAAAQAAAASAQAQVTAGNVTLATTPACQKTLGEVFKIKTWAKDLAVSVWGRPDAPIEDPHYKFDSGAISYLLPHMEEGTLTWFFGPAGTGKSTFWENVAARLKRGYTPIMLSGETEWAPLAGQWVMQSDGSMVFKKGPLSAAMTRPGEIIHIDELSKASSVVDQMQSLFSSGRIVLETGEVVRMAPGVVFAITDNTAGSGDEAGLYSHAIEQCKALIDRPAVMYEARYMPAKVECDVIAGRLGISSPDLIKPFVDLANKTRTDSSTDEPIGHRPLYAWCRTVHYGAPVKEAFEICVVGKMRPAFREHARQAYRAHFDETAAQLLSRAS